MGLTYVTTNIQNLTESGTPFEDLFLVDTGAIDCMAPASKLKACGIKIKGTDTYELANSEMVEYPYGLALVSFMGEEVATRVIFGEEDCEPILGVVALEMAGIGVDPVKKTLLKMSAKPLK